MAFDYQQLCKDIETADPTIHVEIWFDDGSEIIFTRDKTRTCQQQFKLNSSDPVNSKNAANRVLEYWRKSRVRHPESYMTCACHAHVNPIARSWHDSPVVETKSTICPCGIHRLDCDYHK